MEDVVYSTAATSGGQQALELDVYQSGEVCTARRPFVMLIHGGGFTSGSRFFAPFPTLGTALAQRGYVGVSIDYRLEGATHPIPSAEFAAVRDRLAQALIGDGQLPPNPWADAATAAFEDTVNAIRWVQTNADDLCVDPNRFALWGSSAGAYIATYVAYALDEDAINIAKPNVVIDYWGRLMLDNAIASSDPPLLILHGDADSVVPYSYAQELQAQAAAAFLSTSFYTVSGADHGFGDIDLQNTTVDGVSIQEVTFKFIDDHLVGATPTYEVRTIPQQGG